MPTETCARHKRKLLFRHAEKGTGHWHGRSSILMRIHIRPRGKILRPLSGRENMWSLPHSRIIVGHALWTSHRNFSRWRMTVLHIRNQKCTREPWFSMELVTVALDSRRTTSRCHRRILLRVHREGWNFFTLCWQNSFILFQSCLLLSLGFYLSFGGINCDSQDGDSAWVAHYLMMLFAIFSHLNAWFLLVEFFTVSCHRKVSFSFLSPRLRGKLLRSENWKYGWRIIWVR